MCTMLRVLATLLLLALLPSLAPAQTGEKIESDAGASPVIISGWVGEDDTFVGNLRLIVTKAEAQAAQPPAGDGPQGRPAQGGAAFKLSFVPSDLTRVPAEGGGEVIGRQHVSVAPDQAVVTDIPANFLIKVTNVKGAGTYEGTLDVFAPTAGRPASARLTLRLVARVRPSLTPSAGHERVVLNLSQSKPAWWNLNHHLSRMLLPSTLQDKYVLEMEKPRAAEVTVLDGKISLRGEQSKSTLGEPQLRLDLSVKKFSDGVFVNLPVNIERNAIPPDRYAGTIRLNIEGKNEPIQVPVELNVRASPLLPVVFLLAGIAVGKLFKYMQDSGNAKSAALEEANRVRALMLAADAEDSRLLEPTYEAARRMVYLGRVEEAKSQLKSIEGRLAQLSALRDAERILTGDGDPAADQSLQHIRQARELIRQGKDEEARRLLEEVQGTLVKLARTSSMMGGEGEGDREFAHTAERLGDVLDVAANKRGPAPGRPTTGWGRFKDGLARLAGIADEFRDEAALWIGRPLLWVVLLVGLLLLGLNSLYIKNPIFGANPLPDYLSLLFWGLSADVASRAISNLKLEGAGNQK